MVNKEKFRNIKIGKERASRSGAEATNEQRTYLKIEIALKGPSLISVNIVSSAPFPHTSQHTHGSERGDEHGDFQQC